MILNNYNPFNINIAITRSLLALALIITLSFTDIYDLFIIDTFNSPNENSTFGDFSFFILFGWDKLYIAWMTAVVILLFVILGRFSKITSILHWWISLSYIQTAIMVEGGDQISSIITFAIIPLCLLDNRKSHWHDSLPIVEVHPIKLFFSQIIIVLIFIQISYLYFQAGSSKLVIPEWKDGSVMYYWFTNNLFGFSPMSEFYILNEYVLKNNLLLILLTWGTLILEILLAFSLVSSWKFKKIVFLGGLCFHVGTFIFIGLGTFCLVMTGCLILYALPPITKISNISWTNFNEI